ncbi:hypothetical protein [Fervidobacterium sp.]
MEKLNLSSGKKKVFKLSTSIFIILISILPAISFLFVSYQFKVLKTSELLRKYPEVFNNLSSTDLKLLQNQVNNLITSLKQKENEVRMINNEIRTQIVETYRDTYYLRLFFKEVVNSSNKFFLSGVFYDGQKFYIDYYEYGTITHLSTEAIYSSLSKYYKDVAINLLDERNFLGDVRYFHYIWEGRK